MAGMRTHKTCTWATALLGATLLVAPVTGAAEAAPTADAPTAGAPQPRLKRTAVR